MPVKAYSPPRSSGAASGPDNGYGGLSPDNAAVGELVVVTGPPGAGKSSVSEELAKRWKPSALVPGDAFFGMIKRGYILPWLPQSQRQNAVIIEAAAAAAGRLCEICFVVYEGVVGPWLLPTFVRATGLADLHYVALLPPLDVCIERVRSRVAHGFSDPAVTRDKGELGRGTFRYSSP